VLVVRVWVEGESRPQLRGRVIHTLNAATARRVVTFAQNEDEVYTTVKSWLQAFLRHERPEPLQTEETQ
jgi:hypothetical protein